MGEFHIPVPIFSRHVVRLFAPSISMKLTYLLSNIILFALRSAAFIPLAVRYHLYSVTLLINEPRHYGHCKLCKLCTVYLFIVIQWDLITKCGAVIKQSFLSKYKKTPHSPSVRRGMGCLFEYKHWSMSCLSVCCTACTKMPHVIAL